MAHTKDQLVAKYQSLMAQERDRVAAAGGDVVRFNELAAKDLDALRGREDVRTLQNEVNQAYYDAAMKRQDAKGGKSSTRRSILPLVRDRSGRNYGSAGSGASAKELEELRSRHRKEENEQQARLAREAVEHKAALDRDRDEAVLDRRGRTRGWSATALSARASGGSVKVKGTSRSGWTQGVSRARAARDVIGSGAAGRGSGGRPSVGVRVSDDWWAPVDMGSYYDADGKVVTRRYEGGDLGDMNFPRGNGRFQGGVLDPSFISRTTADLMGDMDPSSPGYDRAYQRARAQAREMHAAGMEAFRSWARWAREARDRDNRDRRLAARKSRSERVMEAASAPVVRPEKPTAQAPVAELPVAEPPTAKAPVNNSPSPVDQARLDREIAADIRAPYARDEDYAPSFDAGAAAASIARQARADALRSRRGDGGAEGEAKDMARSADAAENARAFDAARDAISTPAEIEYRKQRAKDDDVAPRAADSAKSLYMATSAAAKGGTADTDAMDMLASASDDDLEAAADPRGKRLAKTPEASIAKLRGLAKLRDAAGAVDPFRDPSTGVTSSRPIVDRRGNVVGQREFYVPDDDKAEFRTQRDWAARGVGGSLPSAALNTMRLARDHASMMSSAARSALGVDRSPTALARTAKIAKSPQARAAAAKMASGKYKMNLAGIRGENSETGLKALFGPMNGARDKILQQAGPRWTARALLREELDHLGRRAADARRNIPSPYDRDRGVEVALDETPHFDQAAREGTVRAGRDFARFLRDAAVTRAGGAVADVGRTIARGFAADARARVAREAAMNASYKAYADDAAARHRAVVQADRRAEKSLKRDFVVPADRRGPADQFGPLPPDGPIAAPREVHIRTPEGKYGLRYFEDFVRGHGKKSAPVRPAWERR